MSATTNPSTPPVRRTRILPLLIMLLLGIIAGIVVALLRPHEFPTKQLSNHLTDPTPTPTVTVTSTVIASAPPGTTRLTLDIPDSCLATLKKSAELAGELGRVSAALQSLDVAEARGVLDQLRNSHPEQFATLTTECRALFDASLQQPTPAPAAS